MGGEAELFYWPTDLNDLCQFLCRFDKHVPITWLGLGSNVLVQEGGIPGLTIMTQGVLMGMEITGQNVSAQAGVSCAQVARFSARNGLVEGEFLAGIPGTIGGALFMNAGAFGGETWEKVTSVTTLNRQGELHRRTPDEFEIAYRSVKGLSQDEWFVSGTFELVPGDGKASLSNIKKLLAKRSETQPTGEHSCGSVFRNPPGDYAGRLIEALDLKGHGVGGVAVSEKHANFIVNRGMGKPSDALKLIEELKSKVKAEYGIELIAEVHVLGVALEVQAEIAHDLEVEA
jgi:UDP-N-acetylmuramate dehydrogenase